MRLPDGVVRRIIFRYLVHYAQNFKSYLIFIKVNYFDILYHVEILTGLAQAC